MAKIINVPGVGEAKVPDSATDADIVAFVRKVQEAGSVKAAYDKAIAERPGAVMSGIYGAGAALSAAGAAAAEDRFDPLANTLYGTSDYLRKESRKYVPEIGSIENIGGIGDAFTYAGEVAGQSLPYMAATLLGGIGGGIVGGPVGAGAGATAVGLPLFTGENIIAQAEADKVPLRETDAGRAFTYAIPQTALDVGSLGVGGKVFKLFNTASQQAKRGVARQIASQLGKSAAAESLTETSQQALQILQADPDRLLEMDDATVSELLNAAVAGGVLGGVLGGGVESYQTIRGQKAEQQAQDLQNTIQREGDEGRGIDLRSETNLGVEALQIKQATPNLEIKPIKKVIKGRDGTDQEVDAFTIRDLGDKSKGKVNIGEFANEEAAKQAVAAYQSMVAKPAGIPPLNTPQITPKAPQAETKLKPTIEAKKPPQPSLPAEAPTIPPGLGKATSELPKAPDNPIPEAPATLDKQREALQRETRAALLYNTTDKVPPKLVNPRIKRIKLEDGRTIDFNRGKFNEQQVREAVANNRLNEILELGPFNKDEVLASEMRGNQPLAVVERTPDGVEVKAAAGTTETAPTQIAALEQTKTAPENIVAIEPVQDLVAGRVAPELTADERVAIWKSVAPQAESFRDLNPNQQAEYFARLKSAQDARASSKPIIKDTIEKIAKDAFEDTLKDDFEEGRKISAATATKAEPEQTVFEDLGDELMGLSADDAPKSRYRAFVKKAIKRGAMTDADARELESFFKDKDMSGEDIYSEIDSILRMNETDQASKKKMSAAPAGGVSSEPVPAIAVLASRPELADKVGESLKKRLSSMGLGKVAFKLQTAVKSEEFGRYGQGAYDPATKTIEISLSAVDPAATDEEFIARLSEIVDHEAIHAVVDLNVLTKEEFSSLLQKAGTTKYPGSNFSYLERAFATYAPMLKNPDGTVDRLAVSEEAVAEMFRDWNAGRLQVQDKPRGLFTRIREFFRRLRGAANDAGFAKVFEEIKSGEIAGREPPGTKAAGEKKLAISPSYTRDNPNYTPEVDDKGKRIRTIVGDPNAQQIKSAFERMDNAAQMFPDPLASDAAWLDTISYAYNEDTGIVMPPVWAIQMAANPQRWASWMKLTPEQISGTDEGFASIKRIGALYRSGKASPDVTGALFFWVYMSRMASAFPHESGFLDAIEGAMPFIRKAQAGTFTADPALVTMTSTSESAKEAKKNAGFPKDSKPFDIAQAGRSDLDDYFIMVGNALPDDSPGQSVTNNMNSFGRDFLVSMSKTAKGTKISRLAALHNALSDPKKTGPEIRRYFHELLEGDGAGFDNKILSFGILMSGREDVLVFDRIQINQKFGGGQTNKIYDDMASGFNGVRGLVIYEAVERGLKGRIQPLYDMIGRPQDGTLGRYHWESWIRSSGQVVGHPTIEALADLAAGESDPFINISSREGRFHRSMYGVQYIRRKGGGKEFIYTLRNGEEYAFTNKSDIDEILNTDNLKKADIAAVPKWFPGVSSFEGGSISWRDYPGVNIDKIEEIIKDKGRLVSAKSNRATSATSGANAARLAGHYATALATRWEFGRKPRGGSPNARLPQSYTEANRADAGRDVIAKYVAKPGVPESYAAAGASSPTYFELDPKASAKKFRDAISKSKAGGVYGAAVQVYDESDYAKMRLFLTEDGMAGFALKGDDIVSVFNTKGGKNKATALAALSLAVQLGGRKLDCFDTVLPGLYAMAGFRAVSRIKFNPDPKIIPQGWNYDTFGAFNGGMPDVVFMVFDPSSWSVYKSTDGDLYLGDDAYDQAVAAQEATIFKELTEEEVKAAKEAKKTQKAEKKLSVAPAYNNVKQFTQADVDKVVEGLTYGAGIDAIQGFVNSKYVKKFVPDRFLPSRKTTSNLIALWADRMIPVGEMIDYVRKSGGKVTDAMDAYMQEDLMRGRVNEDLAFRKDGIYKDLIDYVESSGIKAKATEEEAKRGDYGLEDYLYARHAKERNQRIRDIGNKDPEKGSGMTDADADEILAAVNRSPSKDKILKAASLFDKIIEDTNRVRIEAGLTPDFSAMEVEDEDGNKVIADLRIFKYYAPLRGFLEENPEYVVNSEEELRARVSKGFSVRGREDKQAIGRKSRASDIIAHAVIQNSQAVIRAAKNRVNNSLIQLVKENPKQAEEFGIKILKKKPTKAIINKNGVIQTIVDQNYAQRPDILIVKAMPGVAPEYKGGEQVVLEVSNEALQKALITKKVAGSETAEKILRVTQWVNRWMAAMNTGLNPEFMLVNFPRDLQTAIVNIEQYNTPGLKKKMSKDVFRAARGAWNVIRNPDAKGFWEDAFREFKQQGGMTSGISGVQGIEESIRQIGDMINNPKKGGYSQRAYQAAKATVGILEDANSAVENAIRLSVYKNLVESGFTKERAAQAAKNLTVNFDKRGELGPIFNSLYLFFNASVQGTLSMGMAAARSKKVQKMIGGIVVLGLVQDLLNTLLSPEDEDGKNVYDKIPDYKLRTNFIIMDPFGITDRGYLSIPLPYGYNAFHNFGRSLSRRLRGEYSTIEATNNIMGTFVDAFNPVGGTENFFNAVSPTVLDPFVSVFALNEDFTGRKIYPDPFPGSVPKADSYTHWDGVSPYFKTLTQFLNSATGGSEYVPGMIDFSPEVMEYFFNYALGGAGAFVLRTLETPVNVIIPAFTGDLDEIDLNDVPVFRKLGGTVTDRAITEGYITNANYLLSRGKELDAAIKSGDATRIKDTREKYREELKVYPRVKSLVNRRNKIASDLKKLRNNPRVPENQKRIRVDQMQKQIVDITAEVNKIYENIADKKGIGIF
jgi:hypothetical protein